MAGIVRTEKKDNGDLIIRAQLPGVSRDDVKIDLVEDDEGLSMLTLRAEKNEEHRQTDKHGGSFIRNSQFQIMRTIPLGGKVSSDKIKADLDNDMLVIEVQCPTPSQQKPMSRIDIHQGSSQTRKGVTAGKGGKGAPSKGTSESMPMDEDMPKGTQQQH
jgi:HSP20 family protein